MRRNRGTKREGLGPCKLHTSPVAALVADFTDDFSWLVGPRQPQARWQFELLGELQQGTAFGYVPDNAGDIPISDTHLGTDIGLTPTEHATVEAFQGLHDTSTGIATRIQSHTGQTWIPTFTLPTVLLTS